MPFDLHVARCRSFEELQHGVRAAPVPKRRRLRRTAPARQRPLSEGDFHALMSKAPGRAHGDDTYWVSDPSDGEPWFTARYVAANDPQPSHVVLSVSYGYRLFLRAMGNLVDQALRIADSLDARLFEEVKGSRITAGNVDQLFNVKGDFIRLQAETWRRGIERMDAEGQAPLEFPLGPLDAVGEYLLFQVRGGGESDLEAFRSALDDMPGDLSAEWATETAAMLHDSRAGSPAVKAMLRPDGDVQVWPYYWKEPFSVVAPHTTDVALFMGDRLGAEVTLCGQPFNNALQREVRPQLAGLGVEFYEFVAAHPSLGG